MFRDAAPNSLVLLKEGVTGTTEVFPMSKRETSHPPVKAARTQHNASAAIADPELDCAEVKSAGIGADGAAWALKADGVLTIWNRFNDQSDGYACGSDAVIAEDSDCHSLLCITDDKEVSELKLAGTRVVAERKWRIDAATTTVTAAVAAQNGDLLVGTSDGMLLRVSADAAEHSLDVSRHVEASRLEASVASGGQAPSQSSAQGSGQMMGNLFRWFVGSKSETPSHPLDDATSPAVTSIASIVVSPADSNLIFVATATCIIACRYHAEDGFKPLWEFDCASSTDLVSPQIARVAARNDVVHVLTVCQGSAERNASVLSLTAESGGRKHDDVRLALPQHTPNRTHLNLLPVDASYIAVVCGATYIVASLGASARQPNESQEVFRAAGSSAVLASKLTGDRQVLLLTEDTGVACCGEIIVGDVKHFVDESMRHIRSAMQVGSRTTIDEACADAFEAILQDVQYSEANWARVDVNTEDANVFTALTQNLKSRRMRHNVLLHEVLQSEALGELKPRSIAAFASDQEQLAALVAIRDLQNNTSADQTIRASQQLIKDCVVEVGNAIRETVGQSARKETANAAELFFSNGSHVALFLAALNARHLEIGRGGVATAKELLEEACAIGHIYEEVISSVTSAQQSCASELQWTARDSDGGIQTLLENQCLLMSDTIALATERGTAAAGHAEFIETCFSYLRHVLHFSFLRSSKQDSRFRYAALRRTLLRQPFVRRAIGYPHGNVDVAESPALRIVAQLASTFDVNDVLLDLFLADANGACDTFAHLCSQSAPSLFEDGLARLLDTCREEELRAWLTSSASPFRARSGEIRAFIRHRAPHLHWVLEDDAASLAQFGLVSDAAAVSFGTSAVAHREACVALAGLVRAANGLSQEPLSSHRAVLTAQRKFLSPARDEVVFSVAEIVPQLLVLDDKAAWEEAARVVASSTADERQLEDGAATQQLFASCVKRAVLADTEAALCTLRDDASGDSSRAAALCGTATGQVILASGLRGVQWREVLAAKPQIIEKEVVELVCAVAQVVDST